MSERLGPLELVGGRWIIGDHERSDGEFLVLGPEGLEHRTGAGRPPRPVPWSRFMELDVTLAAHRLSDSDVFTGVAQLAPAVVRIGAHGSCLEGTLRCPYEYWTAPFSRHGRRYGWSEVLLAGELLRQTVEVGAVRRLGDAMWLRSAVARLTGLRPRTLNSARSAVARVLET
ncbi:hypothetical protein [Kitasatospora camelliae]|uniref:Uncharacterized protein n=1 Tax=Kitasatospora camelliae TaxID=3156397 RepID=A0AAU8K741_9ACTN